MVAGEKHPLGTPVVRVAVPSPLRRTFDYWAPRELGACLPGTRVSVPFGRSTRTGIVLESGVTTTVEHDQLKPILERLDPTPTLPPNSLALLEWAAGYYHHPIGEVIRTALPGALRRGTIRRPTEARHWECTDAGRQVALSQLGRAVRQAELLATLQHAVTPISEDEFRAISGWRENLKRLTERGWITQVSPAPSNRVSTRQVVLNPSQEAAVQAVRDSDARFGVYLLDGVTGSGKTEVYLSLIQDAVQRGGQALVLVPEIGLTPQMLARFRAALPFKVVALHSDMSDTARSQAWLAARDGEIDVVIGTRSAVFVPLARPAIFVVDEEHDLSLKQQDGFRYNARDVAVYRARQEEAPILLGSATPALESLRNAHEQRYRHLPLNVRATGAMPTMRIVDVRRKPLDEGLSEPLLAAVARGLDAGEQSLLFVNRRGFAPVVLCHDCGWVCDCARCDSHMVIHATVRRLRCHHCGADRPVPPRCEACGSDELVAVGTGTERGAATLARRFPTARVGRIDRDTVRRQGAMEGMLAQIHERALDVIVGTQMVAKGHHFPHVTLVGIVDADGGLFSADFRAAERMAQLIVQVAGRAGRGETPGEVIVQTHHPTHPLLQALRAEGFPAFAKSALRERAEACLPPFASLALLRGESTAREPVFEFLTQARDLARKGAEVPDRLQVWGPVPAPMERRSGRYRAQLLLQSNERRTLHGMLDPWLEALSNLPAGRRVRWSLDVDPQEML